MDHLRQSGQQRNFLLGLGNWASAGQPAVVTKAVVAKAVVAKAVVT